MEYKSIIIDFPTFRIYVLGKDAYQFCNVLIIVLTDHESHVIQSRELNHQSPTHDLPSSFVYPKVLYASTAALIFFATAMSSSLYLCIASLLLQLLSISAIAPSKVEVLCVAFELLPNEQFA